VWAVIFAISFQNIVYVYLLAVEFFATSIVRYCLHNLLVPTVQPTRCTCYLKLFILVKRSTCFGRSFRPSSGAQNCVYNNDICQTAAATCCYPR